METPHTDPVRDVTLLMMVRQMPEDDFTHMCESILADLPNSLGDKSNVGEHILTCANGWTNCDLCHGPVVDEVVSRMVAASTGLTVCKPCIDEALAALFGPDPEALTVAAHVLKLAARRPGRARHAVRA